MHASISRSVPGRCCRCCCHVAAWLPSCHVAACLILTYMHIDHMNIIYNVYTHDVYNDDTYIQIYACVCVHAPSSCLWVVGLRASERRLTDRFVLAALCKTQNKKTRHKTKQESKPNEIDNSIFEGPCFVPRTCTL